MPPQGGPSTPRRDRPDSGTSDRSTSLHPNQCRQSIPPGAFASRLAASYADLRALGGRQEATLAPLVESARAPVLAEVPLLATDPGSLADLAAVARYLFPDPGRAAAVGVRG